MRVFALFGAISASRGKRAWVDEAGPSGGQDPPAKHPAAYSDMVCRDMFELCQKYHEGMVERRTDGIFNANGPAEPLEELLVNICDDAAEVQNEPLADIRKSVYKALQGCAENDFRLLQYLVLLCRKISVDRMEGCSRGIVRNAYAYFKRAYDTRRRLSEHYRDAFRRLGLGSFKAMIGSGAADESGVLRSLMAARKRRRVQGIRRADTAKGCP